MDPFCFNANLNFIHLRAYFAHGFPYVSVSELFVLYLACGPFRLMTSQVIMAILIM